MPINKTIKFLPTIFQSETNRKFLNATLDQLVTEPNLKPISGYVGRKFTPGFTGIDTYIKEPTAGRANYQLEPSVVVRNPDNGEVEFRTSYLETLQQLSQLGSSVGNQDRLWSSEYYSYDPKINVDAFVNFGQYYWLPTGPEAVDISASGIQMEKTFYVYPNDGTNVFNINGYGISSNPDIVLVRGGTYKFNVDQSGNPFWIQTNSGLTGKQTNNQNLSSRQIYGVTNNGDDKGEVTFVVPDKDAQDFFVNMPVVATPVDFAVKQTYAQVQGQTLADFIATYGGFDGQTSTIDGKYLIFNTYTTSDADWTANAVTVPVNERYGIWQIAIVSGVIELTHVDDIPTNNKVSINYGNTYGNTQWFKDAGGALEQIAPITASMDVLYYQSGINVEQFGIIRLIDANNIVVDVDADILGKTNYVSPNGVTFTNGLKVRFDSKTTPDKYKDTEFYVDGVGTSIVLTPVDNLTINFAQSRTSFDPTTDFTGIATATLNASRDQLTITSSDVPANGIAYGTFPNAANPNYVIAQNLILTYPYRGGLDTQGDHNSLVLNSSTIGVTVPGILINGVSNDWYVQGSAGSLWHYDAAQTLVNGQDSYGGAPESDGSYVYRDSTFITANAWGNVSGFEGGSYTHADGHSKLIGYAEDGYPIYGPFGYASSLDINSGTVRMVSSYIPNNNGLGRPAAKTTTIMANATATTLVTLSSTFGINPGMRITSSDFGIPANEYWVINNGLHTAVGPTTFTGGANQIQLNKPITIPAGASVTFEFLAGAFIEDNEFVPNSGSLDQFNGRYCVTPEFPNGTYAYFATQDNNNKPVYPYFVGSAFYGSVAVDVNSSLTTPEYIVINRSSRDLNAWTRRNRWFHKDIIEATAIYNNTVPLFDQNNRAIRPIIEFKPNMQLFDFGKNGLAPIDLYDTRFTQPFLQVEGQRGIIIDGVELVHGMRVIFSNATDATVRGKIWVINLADISGTGNVVVNLTLADDGTPALDDTVSVFNGVEFVGQNFWFNGTDWVLGQEKTEVNQAPMFDVFDADGVSFGDLDKYPVSNSAMAFTGTKLFGYKVGTGTADAVLGFPLSYKTFNNVGDIQFQNYFDTDTFLYTVDRVDYSKKVNSGFIYQNNADSTTTKLNAWTTVSHVSKQYQDIPYIFDGIDNAFVADITPDTSVDVNNLQVYVNFKLLPITAYQIYIIPNDQLRIIIDPVYLNSGDKVDIFVYNSTVTSSLGYYEIPDNLNFNAQNNVMETPSLGEMRNHIGAMARNALYLSGSFPGSSNLRDLYVNNIGGTMLQQSAPITFASMFLGDTKNNFVSSLINAQHEYTRFKNKFISIASTMQSAAYSDAVTVVDDVLKQINLVKNKNFAWYYSDMVPYGDNKNTIVYSVFDPAQHRYEITSIFSNTTLSNKACLVYINGVQMVYGRDYVFLENAPGIEFDGSIVLDIGDTVTIVEYHDTDGNWIPETPTKLGLYPKHVPEIYTDDTYITPVDFIKGHDGSLTPTFGDFRDDILLELERRIYNNIKVSYSEDLFSIYDSIPGKFRAGGFSLTEFNSVILKTYLQWVGLNRLDYITNNTFEVGNAFTYNYSKSLDKVDGAQLPGSWRACFEYFYDTQRPHTSPWEMLGFSEQPSWWENVYGPAPYTSGNSILWDDLEHGYIASGDRQGFDAKFARPGLSKFIPVDDSGVLLAPIGLLTSNYNLETFNDRWAVGQWSPVETAWRNSSEYPFALMYAAAVTQPAKFFSLGLVTNKYRFNRELKQYTVADTNQRLTAADVDVNGYVDTAGTISRASGYLNWIGDYQISMGANDRNSLLHFVRDYDVNLSYRMAGFSDKKYLKVLADQYSPESVNESVIIPDADYDLTLTKSAPLLNPRYSGVIVEKTSSGFTISGYDTLNPFFTIIPYMPGTDSKSRELVVLNESVLYPTVFTTQRLSLPYGTEFTTLQQLVNFLASYEKYLISLGFRFDYFDQDLGQMRNWELSSKEFLFWVQQGWAAGSVIVLSPVANRISMIVNNATVDTIENSFYGSKVMTQNFAILGSDAYSVTRDTLTNGNTFSVTLANTTDLIGLLDIDMVQFEHTLVFKNKTQFNDVIYSPTMGERQFRLKLVGNKTNEWNGTLSAPGFVYGDPGVDQWVQDTDYLLGDLVDYKGFYYTASRDLPGAPTFNFQDWLPVDKNKIKTGLLSNFARNAGMSVDFYNVDKVNIESEFDKFALGLIGYRNRSYLNDMGMSDVSQVKLYQGFIKQKGTRNAINALGAVGLNNQASTAEINEEWAFRVGAYGSLETNQFVELVLDEDTVISNPTSLQVLSSSDVRYSSITTKPNEVYKTSAAAWTPPFLLNRTENSNRSDDIQTAGFVNIEDVDYTIFDLTQISTLSADIFDIGVGSTIWVAKDYLQTWNVYRVTEPTTTAIRIVNALDNKLLINTSTQHNLVAGDTILMPVANSKFAGFYKVESVEDLTNFVVKFTGSLIGFGALTIDTPIYKLSSLRYEHASDFVDATPRIGWKANTKVWVESNNSNNEWAVYNKSEPWVSADFLKTVGFSTNTLYGTSINIENNGKYVVIGEPGFNSGKGAIANYTLKYGGVLTEDLVYQSVSPNVSAMGFSVDSGTGNVAVGAPTSSSGTGYVIVFTRNQISGSLAKHQTLAPNVAGGLFGYSVSMSDDDRWLYVGAPDTDKVYVYAYDEYVPTKSSFTVKTGNTAPLSFTPASAELLTVANVSVDFVPYVDYTVNGSNLVFTNNNSVGTLTVTQRPGYRWINTINGNAGSNFGFSVASSTEGAQVVVGSPEANVVIGNTSVASGAISVYDRSIEKSIAPQNKTQFSASTPITNNSRVLVNGIPQVLNVDYTIASTYSITFANTVIAGSVVQIETNNFSLVTTSSPAIPYAEQQFGYSVDICTNNCSIYAGAPFQSSNGFFNGAVYRYLNQGRVYGKITGTKLANNVVTPGNSIRINDFVVVFNAVDIDSIVAAINGEDLTNQPIPGITAYNDNGYLTITSSSTVSLNKLALLPGVGTALQDLGLDVFTEVQTINSPDNKQYDCFGKKVKIDNTAFSLMVGSDKASSVEGTVFDSEDTFFDAKSTTFSEYLLMSGAVWAYNYVGNSLSDINNPGKFAFVQYVKPTAGLSYGYGYGCDISIGDFGMIVGANTDSRSYPAAGQVFQFSNPTGSMGWDVYRSQEPTVDLDCILKGYIYSVSNQLVLNTLDYIDPTKGKILGVAEQDITYKTDYDPAVYNNATLDTVSLNVGFHWNDTQVGQVWWDIGAVRYLDYEQGSIKYRTSNWGRMFPNSSIDVYEWVESSYPPSQYSLRGGNGTPKHSDDSAYTTVSYVDPLSNQTVVKYYFWVKDKTTVAKNTFGRTIPTTTIANYIKAPQSSGIKYFAAIRDDSIAIYNVLDKITGTDTVFHLDYSTQLNNNIIHSEYALLSETSGRSGLIPQAIYNKLVDSASGSDVYGNPVPDPLLPIQTRYGIDVRPRQSMFMDRDAAVKEMVTYVNSVFAENIISQGFNLDTLSSAEPLPEAGTDVYDIRVNTIEELSYIDIVVLPTDYRVLVISDSSVDNLWTVYTKSELDVWVLTRVQSYRLTDYWKFIDWFAPGYDQTVKPNFTVSTFADLSNIPVKAQDIVKVLNNGQGKWVLVQVYPNIVTTIGIQDGTIALTENLYNLPAYGMGFGNDNFGTKRFDQNPSIETRKILQALKEDLFINQLGTDFLKLFFVFVYYVLDEQKYIDWAFKTSFINILHKVKGLDQPQVYNKDNQTYYQEYIEEVKPYRSTIREYIMDYEGSDNMTGYVTDFDVPAYFDPILRQYRSPSGEFAQDASALQDNKYRDWLSTYTYVIGSIDVVAGGSGYTVAPQVIITGSTIGNDAVARALVTDGVVTRIEILYGGTHYINTPVVEIVGGNGTGALTHVNLKNDTVRKLKTTLVYDRVTYGSSVQEWTANTVYTQGDIVSYNDVAYIVNADFVSGSTFLGNDLSVYPAAKFSNANDRIQAYYNPATGSTGKNFGLLQSGVDYPGVTVEGPLFIDSGGFDVAAFDQTPFDPLEINSDGTYVISDSILDTKLDGGGWKANVNYQGRPGDYDGATGTAPEDIIIDGGEYVDTYSSHAPEELLPGRVYDTLDMKITTFATLANTAAYTNWVNNDGFYVLKVDVNDGGRGYTTNANAVLGQSNIAVYLDGTTGTAATFTTSLDANGSVVGITVIGAGYGFTTIPNVVITGSNLSVAKASARLAQNDYSTFSYRMFKDMNDNVTYFRVPTNASYLAANLTWTANTITVTNASVLPDPNPAAGVPGVVFIGGERITYFAKDNGTNTLSQIRRGTAGTAAFNHIIGQPVEATGVGQLVPLSENYEAVVDPNVDVTMETTATLPYTFQANVKYVHSELWYTLGVGSDTLAVEFVSNVAGNIITTEASLALGTDETNLPIPTDGNGLYASDKIQAIFIRQ